ncbi:MAG TPA: flagellar hook-associated protein 3 [Spirochaetales bacterium]|nr:flagellar hook-associated protein 3 [Spirochaetales bacterium]HPG85114.1 flagellar hook-associated protein 3 [Spirochaetales bacterium]HPM72103.1 flagellar hook-associated protein 3 [Spirochaetales bacterium]
MRRVSSEFMNTDMQYWLRRNEDRMASMQSKLSRQERLESPRDDPMAAARAVRYESFVGRLSRYEENVLYAKDRADIAEGYMRQGMDIMQRVRELAITGATGTFTKEDSQAMAVEVDQLLAELVSLGNARGPDGDFLFAGDKAKTEPFRALQGYAEGAGAATTVGVDYLGGLGTPKAEIAEGSYLPLNLAGDSVFWSERQRIASAADASAYRVMDSASLFVDGHEVALRPGDTVQAIIAKINGSGAAVKASLDPAKNALVLEATDAHRVRLEDGAGSSVLADLGVLSGSRVPSDYAPTARVSGGSLFDSVIALRDALNKGDFIDVGGRVLASLDAGMENLGRRLAEAGSLSERLDMAALRLNREIPDVTKLLAAEKDLDMTQAITDFKMMEYARNATLQMAGRVLPKSLLDFLR